DNICIRSIGIFRQWAVDMWLFHPDELKALFIYEIIWDAMLAYLGETYTVTTLRFLIASSRCLKLFNVKVYLLSVIQL
ncbi:MAG: hypothetical protein AAGK05_06630, partial [Pseudomonadota bacterium]